MQILFHSKPSAIDYTKYVGTQCRYIVVWKMTVDNTRYRIVFTNVALDKKNHSIVDKKNHSKFYKF